MDPAFYLIATWLTGAFVLSAYGLTSPERRDVRLWALGDAVAAFGIIAFLIRPEIPFLLSIALTNVGVVLQPVLHVAALKILMGKDPGFRLGLLLVFVVAIGNATLVALGGYVVPRAFIQFTAVLITVIPVFFLVTERRRAAKLPILFLAAALTALASLHLFRAIVYLTNVGKADPFPELAADILIVSACIIALLLNMGFLWLVVTAESEAKAAELSAARARAEAASRAKSAFIANMGHELRTPLNAVIGFNQLLSVDRDNPLSAKQAEWSECVDRSGRHLLRLVDDVLDLAQIEAGRLQISLEPIRLAPAVDDAVASLSMAAAARKVAVTTAVADVAVVADATRLGQILTNLLSNAIKYNREGGKVAVKTTLLGSGQLRIEVEDTGIGVPPDRREELFQPFSRLGVERSAIEGTGVGLSVVRQLVESMGGRVGHEDRAFGGSVFWVDLAMAGH